MTGAELRSWREKLGWNQTDLMHELEVRARQTISAWEASEEVPRMVELAIIALDQIEPCRKRGGFESQLTREGISAQQRANATKYFT
jgi:transcriptional regulator with XRE-family HTH domain